MGYAPYKILRPLLHTHAQKFKKRNEKTKKNSLLFRTADVLISGYTNQLTARAIGV